MVVIGRLAVVYECPHRQVRVLTCRPAPCAALRCRPGGPVPELAEGIAVSLDPWLVDGVAPMGDGFGNTVGTASCRI